MRVTAFYNEIDPYAAQWLRNLIVAGYIADGIVDERDIRDIRPDELSGFTQLHFFAGVGIWSLALRLAGIPDDTPIVTGSCPCQPFSSAGRRAGVADERHLWPAFFHFIDHLRPPVVMGEQVAGSDGLAWLDLVSDDLEGAGYTVRAADTCAAGIGAPHIRQRLYWMANAASERRSGIDILLRSDARGRLEGHSPEAAWCSEAGRMADAGRWQLECQRPELASSARAREGQGEEWQRVRHDSRHGGAAIDQWSDHEWIACTDGKFRPVEPGLSTLVDGNTICLANVLSSCRVAADRITKYASTSKENPREVLRMVRDHLYPKEGREEQSVGVREELYAPAVLFDFMLDQATACNRATDRNGLKKASKKTVAGAMRIMRMDRGFMYSPRQRQPIRQQHREPPNTLHELSLLLAHDTQAFGEAVLAAHASINRVNMLKGYGNAIVPQQAAQMIRMLAQP